MAVLGRGAEEKRVIAIAEESDVSRSAWEFLQPRGITRGWKLCGDAEQSVMHLYTKCRKWRTERRILKKSLDKAGVQWQRRPEKKWLAELLANTYAVGSLLEFLKNTEVGSREGTGERMAEWGQRRDQDGEDRLGG